MRQVLLGAVATGMLLTATGSSAETLEEGGWIWAGVRIAVARPDAGDRVFGDVEMAGDLRLASAGAQHQEHVILRREVERAVSP